jgi:hypothetical protein
VQRTSIDCGFRSSPSACSVPISYTTGTSLPAIPGFRTLGKSTYRTWITLAVTNARPAVFHLRWLIGNLTIFTGLQREFLGVSFRARKNFICIQSLTCAITIFGEVPTPPRQIVNMRNSAADAAARCSRYLTETAIIQLYKNASQRKEHTLETALNVC